MIDNYADQSPLTYNYKHSIICMLCICIGVTPKVLAPMARCDGLQCHRVNTL